MAIRAKEKLKTGLMDRDFAPSNIDPCLYLKNGMMVLSYDDDCILHNRR